MVDFVGADFFQFVGGAEAPADAVRVDACRAAHGNVVDGIADHEAFMRRAAEGPHCLFHHVRMRLAGAVIGAPDRIKEMLDIVCPEKAFDALVSLAGRHRDEPAFLAQHFERFQRAIIKRLGEIWPGPSANPGLAIIIHQPVDLGGIGVWRKLAAGFMQAEPDNSARRIIFRRRQGRQGEGLNHDFMN